MTGWTNNNNKQNSSQSVKSICVRIRDEFSGGKRKKMRWKDKLLSGNLIPVLGNGKTRIFWLMNDRQP
jgi:hypothetical protein